MSRILAIVLMLVPMMISAQEWTRIGVMKGAPGMQVVSSDTVQFMVSYGVLYRQGADRIWREQAKVNNVREMRAWGDTVVLIGDQYHWSSNGGKEWSTAPIESRWKIMPNRSWVVTVADRGSRVRVTVKDAFTADSSYMDYDRPASITSTQWMVDRDRVVIWHDEPDQQGRMPLLMISMPSINSTMWTAERKFTYRYPITVASGGIAYQPSLRWVVARRDRFDTIHINDNVPADIDSYQLCDVNGTWFTTSMINLTMPMQLYRYTSQQAWELVDEVSLPQRAHIVGCQGQEMIVASDQAYDGPFRINASVTSIDPDRRALTSPGFYFTNGRYIATYDHSTDERSRFALIRDQSNGPQVIVDTVVPGRIRDVAFVDDVLWVVADSLFSYDPEDRVLRNEQFQGYSVLSTPRVSALPGGVGVSTPGRVHYRANGSATWSLLAEVPYITTDHPFVGTDDGFLLVSPEQEPDLAYGRYYAHRFTMDGKQIGDSVLIGRHYFFGEYDAHAFRRHGSNIYFGTYERVNAVSTDQGATWTVLASPTSRRPFIPTPSAVWWATDTLLYFSSDMMQSQNAFSIPSIGITGEGSAFCLDYNCYTNSVYGLSYIKRPTVGIDEDIDRPSPSTSNVTTAQLINVLGESVGTLPVVDGKLAPFDPTTLPMQVLWAVWGERVVRIR